MAPSLTEVKFPPAPPMPSAITDTKIPTPPPLPPPPSKPLAVTPNALEKTGSQPVSEVRRASPIARPANVAAGTGDVVGHHSDYSSVGDYSDNHDFYDPNDAMLEDEFGMTAMEIEDDEEDEDEEGLVRQDSNFSRLSKQSWLTIDSAEDVDEEDAALGATELLSAQPNSRIKATDTGTGTGTVDTGTGTNTNTGSEPLSDDDDDPLPESSGVLETVRSKRLGEKSVFECAVELLAGMDAYKKKSFRRYGARHVWLSSDVTHLCWTSKKDGVESDSIKLQRVAKLKCVEREVSVDVIEGYRVSLLFSTPDEAGLWARCLSCIIPLQAKVRAPLVYMLKEKDREDYALEDDAFNGYHLRDVFQVNSYAVLGQVLGHTGQARLAFSRSEKRFVAVRYISRRLTPLLLRSYEEIAVLKRLNHPNIVKHNECLLYQARGGTFVVFEHTARGTVADTNKLEGATPVAERIARELILDVISALEYLQALQIAHADVRPDNLLRAVNGAVKLNPLGCITHEFTEVRSMASLTRARLGKNGTSAFLAPELCWKAANAPRLPPKSYAMDVWAVGAVLYFMLFGRVPFGGKDDAAVQDNICEGKLRFPRSPETSRTVRNLLKGVLGEKDPRTRIPLAELKSHPWFTEGALDNSGFGMQPLVVAPEEVDAAVQVAKVRVP